MKNSEKGFTLIELLIAIGTLGILAALSSPLWSDILQNAKYREASSGLASAMREARSLAVGKNLEYRIRLDLDSNTYQIEVGERAFNSSTFTAASSLYSAPENVGLRGGIDSNDDGVFDESCSLNNAGRVVIFQPNGSVRLDSDIDFVCIMDSAEGVVKYRSIIASKATGRVTIE